MGLIDSLRKAEQQGIGVARRSFENVRGGWEDAERRIRRKMRIFPSKQKTMRAAAPAQAWEAGFEKLTDTESAPVDETKHAA